MQDIDPHDQTSGSPVASVTPRAPAAESTPRRRTRISPELQQRLRWLGDFLGDDSPTVWREVRAQFQLAGRLAHPALRRLSRSADPKVRLRARRLLGEYARRIAFRRLCGYVGSQPVQLEKALFLLARYSDPELDVRPSRQLLDSMASEVKARMRARADELHRSAALVDVLGRELGFGGSAAEFHHPDNIHLQRALEKRSGMPLTLCAIYHFVGKRAGIKTALLPLPGHVMLRLYAGSRSLILDPYEKGRSRTERDCRAYLEQNGLGYQPSWFQDASEVQILRRQLLNVQKSAIARGKRAEARDMQTLLVLLDKNPRASAKAG